MGRAGMRWDGTTVYSISSKLPARFRLKFSSGALQTQHERITMEIMDVAGDLCPLAKRAERAKANHGMCSTDVCASSNRTMRLAGGTTTHSHLAASSYTYVHMYVHT
jgi:hypothetical protein